MKKRPKRWIPHFFVSLSLSVSSLQLNKIRIAGYVLLVCIAYYLGAKIGFALTFQPSPVSTLWPPNVILMAALLLAPTRLWPLFLLAAFPAHLAVQIGDGIPVKMMLCWFISNTSEAFIGAVCIRWLNDGKLRFDNYRHVSIFIGFGVLFAPFITSFLDAGFVVLNGWGKTTFWQVFYMRFLSNVLAALTLIPVIVMVGRKGLVNLFRKTFSCYFEAAFLAAGLITVNIIAFGGHGDLLGSVPALVYAPLPFLLWAAVRFGPVGVSASLLATTLLAIWGAIHGRGPFTTLTPSENVISLQIFLMLMAIPMMFLAAVMQERRQTEQALRESEERYRSVVETQTELVCRYLSDTTLTFVNDAYCHYFGKTREELIGTKFLSLIPPSSIEPVFKHIELSIEYHPRISVYEGEVLLPEGGIAWQQWVSHVIFDADGKVVEFQGVGRDITERRQAEEALNQLNSKLEQSVAERTAQLEAKARELETFSYTVAHDLKAPLRGIEGYSHLLKNNYFSKLNEDGRNFLTSIQASAERMHEMIDDLLAYSKFERRPLSSSKIELRSFVEAIVQEKRTDLETRKVKLEINVNGETVTADTEGLAQAIRNYLDNAIKFTHKTTEPCIEIGSEERERSHCLWVRDNGVGFDMKYHDKVFEIFQRLHKMEDHPGTGIGLAIVRKAMERMGGRAWAESSVGKGATFYLEIPKQ